MKSFYKTVGDLVTTIKVNLVQLWLAIVRPSVFFILMVLYSVEVRFFTGLGYL